MILLRYYLGVCLFYGLLFILIAFQNAVMLPVRFLAWQFDRIPFIAVVAVAFLGGVLFAFLLGLGYQLQRRRRLKAYKRNNQELQGELERQVLTETFEDTRPLPPLSCK